MKNHLEPRVDEYIAASAEFARPILRRLRELFHQSCPNVREEIKWSHPFFLLDGKPLANMAAFKAHAAFGFWHRGMQEKLREMGLGAETGMGHFGRIESVADLPSAKILQELIREAVKLHATGSPAKIRAKPKPMPKVPAILAEKLRSDKQAGEAFSTLSPSHQREYIEWIAEGKRPETQAKRVQTTVEWISQGKSRNWKYENC